MWGSSILIRKVEIYSKYRALLYFIFYSVMKFFKSFEKTISDSVELNFISWRLNRKITGEYIVFSLPPFSRFFLFLTWINSWHFIYSIMIVRKSGLRFSNEFKSISLVIQINGFLIDNSSLVQAVIINFLIKFDNINLYFCE